MMTSSSLQDNSWSPPLCVAIIGILFCILIWNIYRFMKMNTGFNAMVTEAFKNYNMNIKLGESRFPHSFQCTPAYDTLLIFRFVSCIYCICIWFNVAYATKFQLFKAYTSWNWTLITVFFICGTIQSLRARRERNTDTEREDTVKHYDIIHLISGNILVVTTIIVTSVVWFILYPNAHRANPTVANEHYLGLNSVSEHILNVIFVQLDFYLSTMPIIDANIRFVLLFTVTYGIVFVIDWFVDGYAIYPFLSLNHALSSIFLLGLFFIHALLFKVYVCISKCKSNGRYGELDRV